MVQYYTLQYSTGASNMLPRVTVTCQASSKACPVHTCNSDSSRLREQHTDYTGLDKHCLSAQHQSVCRPGHLPLQVSCVPATSAYTPTCHCTPHLPLPCVASSWPAVFPAEPPASLATDFSIYSFQPLATSMVLKSVERHNYIA